MSKDERMTLAKGWSWNDDGSAEADDQVTNCGMTVYFDGEIVKIEPHNYDEVAEAPISVITAVVARYRGRRTGKGGTT